jgi:hypothetical protein
MDRAAELFDMRRRGIVPSECVLIEVSHDRLWPWPRNDQEADGSVHVMRVKPDENVDLLDLRCLLGLAVVVTDDRYNDHERTVRALCAACVAAGAREVDGISYRGGVEGSQVGVFEYRKGASSATTSTSRPTSTKPRPEPRCAGRRSTATSC